MGTTNWTNYAWGGTASSNAITLQYKDAATLYVDGSIAQPKPKPADTALAWLDRRVDEMRVAL